MQFPKKINCFLLIVFVTRMGGIVSPSIFKNSKVAGRLCIEFLLFFMIR